MNIDTEEQASWPDSRSQFLFPRNGKSLSPCCAIEPHAL